MGNLSDSFLDTAVHRRALSRWALAAREAENAPVNVVRRQSLRAQALRTHLDRLIHKADERLALPANGAASFPKPHNADWAWRPQAWRGRLPLPGQCMITTESPVGEEIRLFHDCPQSELTLRQLRNRNGDDLAPYGLRLDVFGFEGSFLSLVLDLPDGALTGLKKTHILRASAAIEAEKPLGVFARLNVVQGPNTEQLLRQFPGGAGEATVEFDLAYAKLKEKRVSRAWVDIIFEDPRMNQITLRDLTFCRRPRAQV
ncbi:MAG: DUF6478 family protein [Pseudomonadota bacterium]